MKTTLRVLGCVATLAVLTGCGDKAKKEYHTKAAKASAAVTKKAAKNTMHHGYEAARAHGEESKNKVKKTCRKASDAVCDTARNVKDGVSHAASKVANKAKELAHKAKNEVNRVKHKAEDRYEEAKADHDARVVHHEVHPYGTKKVERKELHTVEVEHDEE